MSAREYTLYLTLSELEWLNDAVMDADDMPHDLEQKLTSAEARLIRHQTVPLHQAVDERRAKRMQDFDAYPPELRAIGHSYGLCILKAFLDLGVNKAKHIRHLVETTMSELSPTRGTASSQGTRATGTISDEARP